MLLDKSLRQLIELLIKTRAMGGNLLLNVTPNPDGTIPSEQENVLRELGLWLFWHRPAIYQAYPYRVTSEADGRIYYTQSKAGDVVYAFIVDEVSYERGMRREFCLKEVTATDGTKVELLGQNGEILEHAPRTQDVKTRFEQRPEGLWISAMRCLRPSGGRDYMYPFVLKISNPKSLS
jgi:alpha-L-fucosidase